MDVVPELQEQVFLQEGGQTQLGHDVGHASLQETPDLAASQVLECARHLGQDEQRLVEPPVLL